MSELPDGFVIDGEGDLPEGFELDAAPQVEQAPYFSWKGQGQRFDRRMNAVESAALQLAKPMSGLAAAASEAMPDFVMPQRAREYVQGLPLRVSEASQAVQQEREAMNPPGFDEGDIEEFATDVAITYPLTGGKAALPLAERLVGGAGTGAVLSPGDEGVGATVGGVANALLPPLLRGVAKGIAPKTQTESGKLAAQGVQLTPGMMFGGAAKTVEDKLTSVPLIGDLIRGGQRAAIESYNTVEINRALAPIKEKVSGAGREAISEAQQKVSDAYGKLLPSLAVKADADFIRNVSSLRSMAANLPPAQAQTFDRALNEYMARFTQHGTMSGQSAQDALSLIGRRINDAYKAGDVDSIAMAGGLKQLKAELMALVDRSNPTRAGDLAAVRQSYAMLSRIEDAAAQAGSKEGVFTPTAMNRSVRKADGSARKRRFAGGNALGQDLAETAESVMGQKVPDSGTTGRALMASVPVIASGGALPFSLPAGIAGLAATAPYLPGGRQVFNWLAYARPPGLNALAKGINKAAPAVTPVALPASNALLYGRE